MTESVTVQDLMDRLRDEAAQDRDPATTPDVGIIMGSDSDLDVMSGAFDALEELGFAAQTDFEDAPDARFTYESYVVSAHRTPELMYAYGETAADRGLDVIVAGAGGKSADLPNMTASIAYPIPVIGVPVQEKSVDSVLGMPTGAPIVAVDAGKSFNAALSAVQTLSRAHPELIERLEQFHEDQKDGVAEVSRDLHDLGAAAFREKHHHD
jgi:5-(carboxyamino)imidazole ribonucleotide mutase